MPFQYARRAKRLSELMERTGTDFLISFHPVNQYYLTGTAQNQVLVFPKNGEPILRVRRNLDRAKDESWVKDIRPMGNMKRELAHIAQELDLKEGTIGVEYTLTAASLFEQLQEAFPGVRIANSDDIWLRTREIKEPEEIEILRKAQIMTDEVHRDMGNVLRPGMTELEFAAKLEYLLRLMGNEVTSPLMYSIGGKALIWRVCTRITSGVQAALAGEHLSAGGIGLSRAVPHGPSNKKIVKGEQVSLNIGLTIQGYTSDSNRTYFLGPPSDEIREMYGTALEAQEMFFAHARPGVVIGELVKRVLQLVEERGYLNYLMGAFPHNETIIGHGVGLFVNEYPTVGPKTRDEFQPGMIMAIEPKIVVPDVGSVEVGELMVITEEGNEVVSDTPRELEDLILEV